MGHNFKNWLLFSLWTIWLFSMIPDHQESIVWTTGKDVLMEAMPGHILNRSIVIKNFSDRRVLRIFKFVFLNVPDADLFISLTGEENVVVDWIPSKAVTFRCMANQLADGFFHGHEIDFAVGGWDGKEITVARAVSCAIDFTIVSDFFYNLNFVALSVDEAFA